MEINSYVVVSCPFPGLPREMLILFGETIIRKTLEFEISQANKVFICFLLITPLKIYN